MIRLFFTNLIGFLCGFFIRNNNKVLVVSAHNKWSGNCKYAVQEIQKKFPEKKIYWAVHDNTHVFQIEQNGCIVLNKGTWTEKYHLLTSKYILSDGYFYGYFSGLGAVHIDFWHGVKPKHLGLPENIFSKKGLGVFLRKTISGLFKKYYTLSMPSDYLVQHMSEVNRYDTGVCKKFNTPMISPLVDEKVLVKELNSIPHMKELSEALKTYKKVYLYAPTWRDLGGDFLTALHFNQSSLQNKLASKNEIIIMKLHPWCNIKDVKNTDNIIFLNDQYETELLVAISDVLITDYSSIYFIALSAAKPSILMHGDINEYTKGRGLYMDMINDMEGIKVKDFTELETIISNSQVSINPSQAVVHKYFNEDAIKNPCKFIELIK